MNEEHSITYFEISYYTPELPPPHCYSCYIKSDVEKNLKTSMELAYYDREEFTAEELMEEGFSKNDDFRWSGNIDKAWLDAFAEILAKTKFRSYKKESDDYVVITAKYTNGNEISGSPSDKEEWESFIQEFMQAIYETSEREAPLKIKFKSIDEDKSIKTLDIELLFATRNARVRSKDKETMLKWWEGKRLIESIYVLDYLPENSYEKEPIKPGNWIEPGHGQWFKCGEGVRNAIKKQDDLGELFRLLERYY